MDKKITVNEEKVKKYYKLFPIKRLVDILVSLVAIIIVFIPCLIIGIIIKIDDGGKIFFLQKRIGRNGKKFRIIKFRTMKEGSNELEEELLKNSKSGFVQVLNDPRVTGPGKFLRKVSADELPQLINVLKGDMSLIGPRPFIPIEADALPENLKDRNRVYPGLTGLAQLKGRSRLHIMKVAQIDIEYINSYSILSDISILVQTIFVVLRGI